MQSTNIPVIYKINRHIKTLDQFCKFGFSNNRVKIWREENSGKISLIIYFTRENHSTYKYIQLCETFTTAHIDDLKIMSKKITNLSKLVIDIAEPRIGIFTKPLMKSIIEALFGNCTIKEYIIGVPFDELQLYAFKIYKIDLCMHTYSNLKDIIPIDEIEYAIEMIMHYNVRQIHIYTVLHKRKNLLKMIKEYLADQPFQISEYGVFILIKREDQD